MTFYSYKKKSIFSKRRFLCTDGLFHTEKEIKRLGLARKIMTGTQIIAFDDQMVVRKVEMDELIYHIPTEERS